MFLLFFFYFYIWFVKMLDYGRKRKKKESGGTWYDLMEWYGEGWVPQRRGDKSTWDGEWGPWGWLVWGPPFGQLWDHDSPHHHSHQCDAIFSFASAFPGPSFSLTLFITAFFTHSLHQFFSFIFSQTFFLLPSSFSLFFISSFFSNKKLKNFP